MFCVRKLLIGGTNDRDIHELDQPGSHRRTHCRMAAPIPQLGRMGTSERLSPAVRSGPGSRGSGQVDLAGLNHRRREGAALDGARRHRLANGNVSRSD